MKQVGKEHFEIFADSVYGSDILYADTLNEARKKAEEWAKDSDCPIVVVKVEEQIVLEVKGEKKCK